MVVVVVRRGGFSEDGRAGESLVFVCVGWERHEFGWDA